MDSTEQQSILVRWINGYQSNAKSDHIKVKFVAGLVIHAGILLTEKDRNPYLIKFRTDQVAFEITIYFFFLCDYWLHRHAKEKGEVMIPIFQRFYVKLFSQVFEGADIIKIIGNRLKLYGDVANHDHENVVPNCFELFVKLALAAKEFKSLRTYVDEWDIPLSFEFDNNMIFKLKMSDYVSDMMPKVISNLKNAIQ